MVMSTVPDELDASERVSLRVRNPPMVGPVTRYSPAAWHVGMKIYVFVIVP